MSKNLFVRDDLCVKWENDGKKYCVVFKYDDTPLNYEDFGFESKMYFFHKRYDYGMSHKYKESLDMWHNLVEERVPEKEILQYALDGKIEKFHIEESDKETFSIEWDEYPSWKVTDCTKYQALRDIMDELGSYDCQKLLLPYAAWRFVYGYDHSGLSISLDGDTYPYNDRWDAGILGVAIIFKKDFIDSGCANEENWKEKAGEFIRDEVETYKTYIEGEVFGYEMYIFDPELGDDEDDFDNWEEVEPSVWGFFGSDAMENGMTYEIGNGFEEAIESGRYEEKNINYRAVPYFA